jgi:hypothetical protein
MPGQQVADEGRGCPVALSHRDRPITRQPRECGNHLHLRLPAQRHLAGNQVSNWNDDRASRERERVYLERLLIDLESDRATGERGIRTAGELDAVSEVLLALLEGVGCGTGQQRRASVCR